MISVKVTYTVRPGFVAQNLQHIQLFLDDFRALDNDDFRYSVYISQDGKTFVHHSLYRNEVIQQQLLNTGSFKSFQQKRDESGLEMQPQVDVMTVAGASHPLL